MKGLSLSVDRAQMLILLFREETREKYYLNIDLEEPIGFSRLRDSLTSHLSTPAIYR